MQAVRSRTGRAIASTVFLVAQIVFWMSFLLLPFNVFSGFIQIRLILYILQSQLFLGGQLAASDAIFFAYPIGMLIALVAWVFKVRRAGLLALLAYLGILSTGSTTDIGFLICMAAIAVCALTVITE